MTHDWKVRDKALVGITVSWSWEDTFDGTSLYASVNKSSGEFNAGGKPHAIETEIYCVALCDGNRVKRQPDRLVKPNAAFSLQELCPEIYQKFRQWVLTPNLVKH